MISDTTFCDFVAMVHWTFSVVQRDGDPEPVALYQLLFCFCSFVLLFIFVPSTSHTKEMTPIFLIINRKWINSLI